MMESSRSLHKRHQDRISKLPDEILISIISRLTLREATATSLLSTCWRHLHTYITHLDFPPRSYSSDPSIDRENRLNHINMVNHVLYYSHRGSRIKEFKVQTFDESIGFEKLLGFALTKKAEIINIDIWDRQFHTLSRTILKYDLKCLEELSLSGIDMTDQDFDLLVSNCLALESLSIKFPSPELENVSIVGHSKLKHFGLSYAWLVRSIEIRDAINLVSLKWYELSCECVVQLSNIPKLSKIDYKDSFNTLPHAELFAKMPCCIRDQLHVLHLSTCCSSIYPMHALLVDMSVDLLNITHLELVIDLDYESGFFLLNLHCLIEACRSLQKLIIKFSWNLSRMGFKKVEALTSKLSPKYLKEMEISGYRGSSFELNLALHVVNQARALEKLIVVPCDLNDTVREEALARAQRDFQHITSFKLMI